MLFEDLLVSKDGLIKGPFGGDITKSLFVPKCEDSYKVYEQGVVLNNNINIGNYYISKDYFEKKLKRFEVKERDILMTGAGTLGKLFIAPSNAPKGVINQALLRIRLNMNVVNQTFFCYYFKYYIKSIISNINGDSVIPNLPPLPIIKATVIDIPDLHIQQKIASVLSTLDSKIELNNCINVELETMAKTLYDYWFVQFDFPDENGKPYKISGGKMIWNDELKREIPVSWKVEIIEKSCEITDCLHSKKPDLNFEEDGYFLLQLENIRDDGLIDLTNKYFVTKEIYEQWTSRIEVIPNDIIITNAGRVGATAQIPEGIKAGIGRNITAIRPITVNPTYLFLSLRGIDMKRQIKWNTDSGAFFSSLNVKGIKKLYIVRPPKFIEDKFEKIVHSTRRQRESNNFENQKLSELRDWLLPMLMNGQVKVKESSI